jgi:hypothetical protein
MTGISAGQSNANTAFRTLRRMLGLAIEWQILKRAPKIATELQNWEAHFGRCCRKTG